MSGEAWSSVSFEIAKPAGSAAPTGAMAARPWVRLRRLDSKQALLAGRGLAKTPLLVALMVIPFAFVPLLASGDVTPERIATSVLLVAVGSLLLWQSWPNQTRIRVDIEKRTLQAAGKQWAFGDLTQFVLCGELVHYDDVIECRYQVDVLLKSGERLALLAHKDPEKVFGDLSRLAPVLGLPLTAGWGLSKPPLIRSERGPSAGRVAPVFAQGITLRVSPLHHPRVIGKVVIAFGLIALLNWALLAGIEIEPGFENLALSLFLPACTAGFVLLVGLAVLTRYDELRIDTELSVARRVVALRWKRRSVSLEQIQAVHLISPDGERARHILLMTGSGPLCFPYSPEIADTAVEALRKLVEPVHSSAEEGKGWGKD